jgi:hypothetical protein
LLGVLLVELRISSLSIRQFPINGYILRNDPTEVSDILVGSDLEK